MMISLIDNSSNIKYYKLKELGLNPIFGYTKTKTAECMRYTRYVEAV